MTWTVWAALAVTACAIVALVKRAETRMVLIVAGFAMAILSLNPMEAFRQFDKSMTNAGLIISICSAMGFAAVVSLTKCDIHLVALLTKPLKKMGLLLLPLCMLVTGFVAIAIPSTAGCVAAVGPTLIPLMIRAGFRPAAAAAAVVASITPAMFNPGVAHNVMVSKIAEIEVMDFVLRYSNFTAMCAISVIVIVTALAFFYHDFGGNYETRAASASGNGAKAQEPDLPEKPNILFAIAPMVPVALLVVVSLQMPELKMSVATAMLIGTVYALAVTRTNPADVTKKFFDGMGRGYASILGIIIAAGVFAAGLRACGVIDLFVNYLTSANEVAKIGGSFGPYVLGVLTGSGDAATFAFNEAVTPHARSFGLEPDLLGYLAMMSAHFGRLSSPLAGGLILAAGIAGVNPIEIVKRTAPAMFVTMIVLYVVL